MFLLCLFLDYELCVDISIKGEIVSNQFCKMCVVRIENKDLFADLHILYIGVYTPLRVVFALQARRLVQSGCKRYLNVVIETRMKELMIEEIPISKALYSMALMESKEATQRDLAVRLYMQVHVLLPMLNGKSSCNAQSRNLILHLAKRIISSPKACPILVNGAVRKGKRLVPPSTLKLLMRIAFPAPLARVKVIERFKAIYLTLKEVTFVDSPKSKYLIFNSIAGVCDVFIWCLTQNPKCYKQWDAVMMEVIVLFSWKRSISLRVLYRLMMQGVMMLV
ncbi:Uncharacterized protein TCM_002449 [Theobroma cacao]|uniref:Uncharacterized protein n=1 Tax=Theobroma cacao TaxID=3641 RepID=A0A061DL67_THECC|nr:Uncharacterized protein TCM_002449 [Theobroma cacao]